MVVLITGAGALPWSVQTFAGGEVLLRFLWGAVSFDPALYVSTITAYPLLSGPPILVWWLLTTVCWLGAVVSAATGWVGMEDGRVTAGLLVLSGFANLLVALEFGVQPARTGWPVGTIVAWLLAGWRYRAVLLARSPGLAD